MLKIIIFMTINLIMVAKVLFDYQDQRWSLWALIDYEKTKPLRVALDMTEFSGLFCTE